MSHPSGTPTTSFIPYGTQWVDDDDKQAILNVLESNWLTQGPVLEAFEAAMAEYCGANYAVAVTSGTAALHLACLALGVEPGDEGITSPISFSATANALCYAQAVPAFEDVESPIPLLNPEKVKLRIRCGTQLIIPVHYAGFICDMEKLRTIAGPSVRILEDASHAVGSVYHGNKVGSCEFSDCAIFSFHPVKHLTTGEGGMILTNQADIYEQLVLLRNHGIERQPEKMKRYEGPWYYEMQQLGFNYRMSDIQAALGLSQLKKLDFFIARRREIVQKYNEAFNEIPGIQIPLEPEGQQAAYHLYPLQIQYSDFKINRTQLMNQLKQLGIGTQVHYIPIYKHPYYQQHFGYFPQEFPNSELFYKQTLSIPLYPKMTDDQVQYVIDSILSILVSDF